MSMQIIIGDCRETLKLIPEQLVQCCVTSPPYWGLRDYGHADQIGQEESPDAYVKTIVDVFRLVREALHETGTVWLNLGDTYAGSGHGGNLKPKDLTGIPWRVAFALQSDGWYLRQDIIWNKPNPMPESVTDRCTKSHEYIFLLTKSPRYYYDQDAIKEPMSESSCERLDQDVENQTGSNRVPGKTNGNMKAVGRTGQNAFRGQGHFRDGQGPANRDGRLMKEIGASSMRNKRSVWTVTTKPYKDAHFATFPEDLIKPCILAGCHIGGTVLDPFGGSGTTGQVALELGRNAILCELNPEYVKLIEQRTNITPGLNLQ